MNTIINRMQQFVLKRKTHLLLIVVCILTGLTHANSDDSSPFLEGFSVNPPEATTQSREKVQERVQVKNPVGSRVESQITPVITSVKMNAQELNQIFDEATQKLTSIREMVVRKDFENAFKTSRNYLLQALEKVGINPKAKLQNKIPMIASGVLSSRDLFEPFDNLDNNKQAAITESVVYHFGANMIFIDFLNYIKRISFYKSLSEIHLINKNDPAKNIRTRQIVDDIMSAYHIPLLVQDEKLDLAFIVFDTEVVNEVYNREFNNELVDFLLRDKLIGLSENDFFNYSNEKKMKIRNDYQKGIKNTVYIDSDPRWSNNLETCMGATYGPTVVPSTGPLTVSYERAKQICYEKVPMRQCIWRNHPIPHASFDRALDLCNLTLYPINHNQ